MENGLWGAHVKGRLNRKLLKLPRQKMLGLDQGRCGSTGQKWLEMEQNLKNLTGLIGRLDLRVRKRERNKR